MKPPSITVEAKLFLETLPEWQVTIPQLDRLAQVILGENNEGWLRKPNERGIIASSRLGGDASCFKAEFMRLGEQCASILTSGETGSVYQAVAFFHMRLTAIHPFRDGNGRISRLLLAKQISSSIDLNIPQILLTFFENQREYYVSRIESNPAS